MLVTPTLRHCAFLLAVWMMVLVCIPLVLVFVKRWLFDMRCLSLRTFDYSGFLRAVALMRYTGKTIAETGEGIAIHCDAHFGRCVEMFYVPPIDFRRQLSTVTRLTFNKFRWSTCRVCHTSISREVVECVCDSVGVSCEEDPINWRWIFRAECDLLLVHEAPGFDLLDRKVKEWAEGQIYKAIKMIAEAPTC